jgi:vacuolar protein sorting-associated protein 11
VFRRKLFKLAISLATSRQYDNQSVMDIYRKYGDYLYEEEKFGESMQQYEKTIGHLEPSYVIRYATSCYLCVHTSSPPLLM